MFKQLRPALSLLVLLTLVTGVAYPLLVTGISELAFLDRAHGSLIVRDGKVAGSALVGQGFAGQGHFWSRPSATGPYGYNAGASSGSNLGPTNPALTDAVKARIETLRAAHPQATAPVPVDLVTSSGSGLDPHVTPAAAAWQVERVAQARGLPAERVRTLVAEHTEPPQWGVLGEARVNVLRLNLALDTLSR
ncbi:MAG: potassium-transporting ATPase subunit KdpC [Gammaproteobacteria bacterium]